MTPELTLDPEDWENLKTLGHEIIDDMLCVGGLDTILMNK